MLHRTFTPFSPIAMKWRGQAALFALLLAVILNLIGIPTTFAATSHPHSSPLSPNYITVQCLEEVAYITEYKDNQADGTGESYNACFATTAINQIIRITSSCPGYGNGTGTIPTSQSVSVDSSLIQNFGVNAGCVVCHYVNGKLVGKSYPDFYLVATVTATGSFTYHGIAYKATSNTATDKTLIQNTGLYAPPCPPTD